MKYLSLCLALGAALTLTACATTPSKPKTFDQLGQFHHHTNPVQQENHYQTK